MFLYEISGLAIVTMLDSKVENIMRLKLKFIQNLATFNVTNSSLEMVIFNPKEMLRVLDFKIDRLLLNKARNSTTELK